MGETTGLHFAARAQHQGALFSQGGGGASQKENLTKGGLTRRQVDGMRGVIDVRKATMNEEGRFGTIVPNSTTTSINKQLWRETGYSLQ